MTECELILSFSYNRLKHYRMLSATRPKYTQRIQGYNQSSSRFKRYERKNIKDEYVLSDMEQARTHEWRIFSMWISSPVKQNRSAGLLENYLFYFYVCVLHTHKSVSRNGVGFITTFIFIKRQLFFLQFHSTVTFVQNSKTKKNT